MSCGGTAMFPRPWRVLRPITMALRRRRQGQADARRYLYACESLPPLPLPPLHQTLDRLLAAAAPFSRVSDEISCLGSSIAQWEVGPGVRLQNALQERAKTQCNWLEAWWLETAYLQQRRWVQESPIFSLLHSAHPVAPKPGGPTAYTTPHHRPLTVHRTHAVMFLFLWVCFSRSHTNTTNTSPHRSPLPVNSNFAVILALPSEPVAQCVRAAALLHGALAYHQLVLDGEIVTETARGQPQCMAQYRRLFSQARVPDIPVDCLVSGPESARHVIVMRGGHVFRVVVKTADGQRPLPPATLRQQLEAVCSTAAGFPPCQFPVGLLTAGERDNWARAREILRKVRLLACATTVAIQTPLVNLPIGATRAERRQPRQPGVYRQRIMRSVPGRGGCRHSVRGHVPVPTRAGKWAIHGKPVSGKACGCLKFQGWTFSDSHSIKLCPMPSVGSIRCS